jgi:chemotaxis protein histidine kinase CheA
MRQRLSWDKEASMSKKADPYTMNQDHANNPINKYQTGDPSKWGEDPDMKTPWKGEGRTEVGLPAPERAAVKAARMLEDKALKCITIAQRMLPGATDEMIEAQATDLMYMPENVVLATLSRQAELAEVLSGKDPEEVEPEDEKDAGKKKEEEEEADASKKKEEEEVDAKKKPEEEEEVDAKKKKEEEEVDAGKKPKTEYEEKEKDAKKKPEEEEEVDAKKKVDPELEEKDAGKKKEEEEEVEAGKKKEELKDEKDAKKKVDPELEEKDAKKKPEEEEEVDANSIDLLDQIFAAETVKTGAKKLSGIVKQASTDSVSLDSLWSAPPDVSKAFR